MELGHPVQAPCMVGMEQWSLTNLAYYETVESVLISELSSLRKVNIFGAAKGVLFIEASLFQGVLGFNKQFCWVQGFIRNPSN